MVTGVVPPKGNSRIEGLCGLRDYFDENEQSHVRCFLLSQKRGNNFGSASVNLPMLRGAVSKNLAKVCSQCGTNASVCLVAQAPALNEVVDLAMAWPCYIKAGVFVLCAWSVIRPVLSC